MERLGVGLKDKPKSTASILRVLQSVSNQGRVKEPRYVRSTSLAHLEAFLTIGRLHDASNCEYLRNNEPRKRSLRKAVINR